MWNQKNAALAIAAIVAGLSTPSALAQNYYDESGYYDENGTGQYGADPYYSSYDDSGYYDQGAASSYGPNQYDSGQYGAPQYGDGVSFDYFYDFLAPHGQWFRHARWGDVWRPINVSPDFRPYFQDGYWANTTEYGWTWASDYPWGEIAFHYGRWVHDPYDGWIWIPGYVWAPSWVIWRSGAGHIGWFPMPPTDSFLLGVEVYDNSWRNWGQSFGYTDWYGPSYGLSWSISQWVFVDELRFGHRNFHRWVAPRRHVRNIIRNTTNITNYVTEDNYIVNRSFRGRRFNRGRGLGYDARPAREVFGREGRRTRADAGRRIHERERRLHGGNPNASARERLTDLPRGAGLPRGDGRRAENRRDRPRAEQIGQEPRVRDETVRPGRARRDANAGNGGPNRQGVNQRPGREAGADNAARNTQAANPRPARERTTTQPRVRDETVRPGRPRREQTAQQPRTRQQNARPNRPNREARPAITQRNNQRVNTNPRREQATQQPRTRQQNARPQRPQRPERAQRPRREQTAQQPRTRTQNARPQRPQRAASTNPQRAERAQRAQRAQPVQRVARAERTQHAERQPRPQRERAARQTRADNEDARPNRQQRVRRNRGG